MLGDVFVMAISISSDHGMTVSSHKFSNEFSAFRNSIRSEASKLAKSKSSGLNFNQQHCKRLIILKVWDSENLGSSIMSNKN